MIGAGARASRIPAAVAVIGGALLVALGARVQVPVFGAAYPVTLQTFAVLIVALLLSPPRAIASMSLYFAMAVVGLPVCSLGVATLGSWGYLAGFIAGAGLVSFAVRRVPGGVVGASLFCTAGTAIMLLCGGIWCAFAAMAFGLAEGDVVKAFAASTVPFIPGGLLKSVVAAMLFTGGRSLFGKQKDSGASSAA